LPAAWSGWAVKYKTVPYVAEVDSHGAALAIKPADPGGHPADERTVRYQPAPFSRGGRHECRADPRDPGRATRSP